MRKFLNSMMMGFVSIITLNAEARPTLLATELENEVIVLIQDMAADSWEEANIEAKIDGVYYDQEQQAILIAYETRELDSSQPFVRQPPLEVRGISSQHEIVQEAANGFRSLNDKITRQILETI